MEKYIIYGLFCPFLNKIHYVGKSSSYLIRPKEHMTKSHSDKINEWVSHLELLNYQPIIKILEICTENNLDEREKFWIDKYKKEGEYLLNVSHNVSTKITAQPYYQNEDIVVKKLGQTIKKIRKQKKLTQTDLSESINLSRNTLFLLENGNGGTSLSTLIKVLNTLNIEIILQSKNE